METNDIKNLIDLLQGRVKIEDSEMKHFVDEMFSVIRQGLEHDKVVKVKGLGVFKLIDVDARESISVNSGERVLIEGHGKISFVPDATMKELVNKPFSQFETVVLNDGVDFSEMDSPADDDDTEEKEPVAEGSLKEEKQEQPDENANVDKEPTKEEVPVVTDSSEDKLEETVTNQEDSVEQSDAEQNGKSAEQNDAKEGELELNEVESGIEESRVETVSAVDEQVQEAGQKEDNVAEETVTGENISVAVPHEKKKSRCKNIVWHTLVCAVLVGVSGFGGYMWGRYDAQQGNIPEQDKEPVISVVQPATSDTIMIEEKLESNEAEQPASSDSVKAESNIHADEPVNNKETHEKTKVAEKAEKEKPAQAQNSYDNDVRVRTGAYRIVGTSKVVTAKAGETLKSISDRTLGPGMECYIEVLNNMSSATAIKAGQKIKIPELVLRKKSK